MPSASPRASPVRAPTARSRSPVVTGATMPCAAPGSGRLRSTAAPRRRATPRAMDFRSVYRHGFLRVAACTITTSIGVPAANAEAVLQAARDCHDEGVGLAVFPELTLSGYSIEDLLMQDTLLDAVQRALLDVVAGSAGLLPVLVVGAPLRHRHRIYNTAVVMHRGRILGVAPKSYLPTYREFYERRQVAAGDDVRGTIRIGDHE